jgi:hypothetical protein
MKSSISLLCDSIYNGRRRRARHRPVRKYVRDALIFRVKLKPAAGSKIQPAKATMLSHKQKEK